MMASKLSLMTLKGYFNCDDYFKDISTPNVFHWALVKNGKIFEQNFFGTS
jgi:hypothetical protein